MKLRALLAALGVLVLPRAAAACSVCWGGASNSPWIGASIWVYIFLLALTYGLIGSGVVAFVISRRRAVRDSEETQ
jgi:hypothetical protein